MLEEHDRLLCEWQAQPHHRDQGFIRDGVISPAKWDAAPRKVVFVFKEAYDNDARPEGYDLCRSLRNKGLMTKKSMWRAVADWAWAALHGSTDRIPPLSSASPSQRVEALCACAVINVKKSGGKPTSRAGDIARYAQKDGPLLRRQIELLAPDLVICGNTWKAIRHLWATEWQPVDDRVVRVGRCFFVSFWHPAIRCPKWLSYYALAWLLQNAGCLAGETAAEPDQAAPAGDAMTYLGDKRCRSS
jgi:hypothetical protein